jgi:ferredoxin
MRVFLDDDNCRGHGVCTAICPEVFELTPDGFAVVLIEDVPFELEGAVADAAAGCPERAITVATS